MLTWGGVNPLLVLVNWCWFTEFPYMLCLPEKVDNGKIVIAFFADNKFRWKQLCDYICKQKLYFHHTLQIYFIYFNKTIGFL